MQNTFHSDKLPLMERIVYLIKFVDKFSHAQQIVNGFFYMRTVSYYKNDFESEARDIHEGNISHKFAISKGTNHYVFCTYKITDKMIKNDFVITKELIRHFGRKKKYAVVIKFGELEKILRKSKTSSYRLIGREIQYGVIRSIDVTKTLLLDKNYGSLSIKLPMFEIENEYRFISGNTSDNDDIPFVLNIGHRMDSISRIVDLNKLFKDRESISIMEFISGLK